VIGALAILGGIGVQGQNVAFLVALAFAVAASANLPTILYSLFWSKFTTRGAVWSMIGGLVSAVLLIAFSPVVSGDPAAMLGDSVDFAIFPLKNPGIVSIPLGFFLGWLGSVTSGSGRSESKKLAAEMEVRALTGYGAEPPVDH
jgi:cation/acetate symporter